MIRALMVFLHTSWVVLFGLTVVLTLLMFMMVVGSLIFYSLLGLSEPLSFFLSIILSVVTICGLFAVIEDQPTTAIKVAKFLRLTR